VVEEDVGEEALRDAADGVRGKAESGKGVIGWREDGVLTGSAAKTAAMRVSKRPA
jgi:hypothetical protein